jgi:hypothetical protein
LPNDEWGGPGGEGDAFLVRESIGSISLKPGSDLSAMKTVALAEARQYEEL